MKHCIFQSINFNTECSNTPGNRLLWSSQDFSLSVARQLITDSLNLLLMFGIVFVKSKFE